MKGFFSNIENDSKKNLNFRKVVYTSKFSQLVLMTLKPGEEIGMEIHGNDQFFRIESGTGKCLIDGNQYDLAGGVVIIVPAGSQHNIINTSESDLLQLYTIYSPPHHKDGIIAETKAEAEKNGQDFDGQTTELKI